MQSSYFAALFLAGAALLGAANHLNTEEADFVKTTLAGGRHEVDMAKMALAQGSDAKVKEFAQRLVNDHTAVNRKLEDLAKKNGVTADGKAAPKGNQPDLSTLKGKDFDRAWVKQMVEAHQAGVAKFEGMQAKAKNDDLRNLVVTTLPTLREHLRQAQSLNP
jgi:putative membrane protein